MHYLLRTLLIVVALCPQISTAIDKDSALVAQMLPALLHPAPREVAEATSAYEKLKGAGNADVRVVYAMALVLLREDRTKNASELLESLPASAQANPTVARLRLYLALELADEELALARIKQLYLFATESSAKLSDRVEIVAMLGKVLGMHQGIKEVGTLPKSTRNEVHQKLLHLDLAVLRSAYSRAFEASKVRREELEILTTRIERAAVEDLRAELTLLLKAETAEEARLSELEGRFAKDTSDNSAVRKTEQTEASSIAKEIKAMRREANRMTPGHPGRRPSEPVRKRVPDKDDKNFGSKSSPSTEAEADRDYRSDMESYEKNIAAYHSILTAWQVRDRERRLGLATRERDLLAARAKQTDIQEDRSKAVGELQRQIEKQKRDVRDLSERTRLIKAVLGKEGRTAPDIFLASPRHYDLISFEAEHSRLKATIR